MRTITYISPIMEVETLRGLALANKLGLNEEQVRSMHSGFMASRTRRVKTYELKKQGKYISDRQKEVIKLRRQGLTVKLIAIKLKMSPTTVFRDISQYNKRPDLDKSTS